MLVYQRVQVRYFMRTSMVYSSSIFPKKTIPIKSNRYVFTATIIYIYILNIWPCKKLGMLPGQFLGVDSASLLARWWSPRTWQFNMAIGQIDLFFSWTMMFFFGFLSHFSHHHKIRSIWPIAYHLEQLTWEFPMIFQMIFQWFSHHFPNDFRWFSNVVGFSNDFPSMDSPHMELGESTGEPPQQQGRHFSLKKRSGDGQVRDGDQNHQKPPLV